MKRKVLSVLLSAVMLVGILSACGQSDSGGGASEESTKAPTETSEGSEPAGEEAVAESSEGFGEDRNLEGEITIWDWNNAYEEKMHPVFHEAYPNIKVNYVTVAHGDFMQKLQSAIATGTDVPDVILGEMTWRGKLFDMDVLENLEAAPYNVDRNDMLDYVHNGLSNFRGEIVGLDQSIVPAGLAYRRDLAKEYLGTDDPEEVYELISTWDDFIATGQDVQEKSGGQVTMLSSLGDILAITRLQHCMEYIDDNVIDITKRMKEPLEMAIRVRDAGILGDHEEDAPSWHADFASGNNIFFPSAPWSCEWHVYANDPDGGGNWGLTKAPESGFTKGGTSVGIYKDSPNKEAAWAYIKWTFFSLEGSVAARDIIGQYISLKECYEGDNAVWNVPGAYDEYFGGQNLLKYFIEEIVPDITTTQRETSYETTVTQSFTKLNPTLATDLSIDAAQALELLKEEISIAEMDAEVK